MDGAVDRDATGGPPFAVRVISAGDRAARVLVTGELDLATAPELDSALATALGAADDVVLDLSRVTFIDSTGLSTILAGLSTSQLNRRKLTISSALAPQPRRLFELSGIDAALQLAEE